MVLFNRTSIKSIVSVLSGVAIVTTACGDHLSSQPPPRVQAERPLGQEASTLVAGVEVPYSAISDAVEKAIGSFWSIPIDGSIKKKIRVRVGPLKAAGPFRPATAAG